MPARRLKRKLQLHRGLLEKLCKEPTVAKGTVLNLKDKEVDFLLEVLHHILTGKIPVSEEVLNTLVENRDLAYLQKNLEADIDFKHLLERERLPKVQIILRVKKSLPCLAGVFFPNDDDGDGSNDESASGL